MFSYDDNVSTGVEAFYIETYKNNTGYEAFVADSIYGEEMLLTIKKGASCVLFNGKLVAINKAAGYELYGNSNGDTIVIADYGKEATFIICNIAEVAKAINNL